MATRRTVLRKCRINRLIQFGYDPAQKQTRLSGTSAVSEGQPLCASPYLLKVLMKNEFIDFHGALFILFDGLFSVMMESIPSFRRHT